MKRYVSTWAPVCALIGISLALISCGKKSSSDGLPTASSSLSSATTGYDPVVMVVLPSGGGICTGTVISPKAVLTAAHCTKTAGRYTVTGNIGTFSTYTAVNFGAGVVDDPNDISVLVFDSAIATSSQIYNIGSSVRSGDTLRLVGYGCNSLSTRTGAGTKRTGTNVVSEMSEYVEFLTPRSYSAGILGPSNRAGSCFGDSGGPALKEGSTTEIVAVTHAGGYYGDNILSQYVDLTRSDNRSFLSSVNSTYSLGIQGL